MTETQRTERESLLSLLTELLRLGDSEGCEACSERLEQLGEAE
jgi:hypothetical protein